MRLKLFLLSTLLTGIAYALGGCAAGAPTVSDHLRATEIALKGVHVRHKQDVDSWSKGVDERIASCLPVQSKADRKTCMGAFGEGEDYEAAAAELAEAYDKIVADLEAARAAAARLQQLYDQAAEGNAS